MIKLFKKIKSFFDNKIVKVITTIIRVILYIILCSVLFVIVVQKVSNNNLSVGGFRFYTVASGSMEPVYNVGDVVVSRVIDENELKIGDDITYLGKVRDYNGLIITHRIIDIEENEDGKLVFTTKGVANSVEDPSITYDQIYGKVIYKVKTLSFISRLMMNVIWYYVIFTIVALITSFQIVKMIFNRSEEDEDDDEEGEEESTKDNN